MLTRSVHVTQCYEISIRLSRRILDVSDSARLQGYEFFVGIVLVASTETIRSHCWRISIDQVSSHHLQVALVHMC